MVGMVKEASIVPLAHEEFPRFSYAEAVDRFGTDRPDIRFGMELVNVADIVGKSSFRVFTENVAAGKPVKAISIPGCGSYSRKQLGELDTLAKEQGAKGVGLAGDPPGDGTDSWSDCQVLHRRSAYKAN